MNNRTLQLISGCLFFLLSFHTHSTTILRLDLNDLLQQAELIFEGEVISSKAQWNDNRTSIVTLILFRVDEVIKGDFEEQTLELEFQGGSVDGITLEISDMEYPELKQKGIYFIEQLAQKQLNPLLGWSQGSFRIITDNNGIERIHTSNNKPVLSANPAASLVERSAILDTQPFSHGIAAGMTIGRTENRKGMDKRSFKKTLRDRLKQFKINNAE